MREIKFRAWDKEGKRMFEVDEIEFTWKKGSFKGGRVLYVVSKDGYEFDCMKVELMQFTGLKDKNGKEIFEGDIIKISCWEERKHYKDAKKKNCEGIFLVKVVNNSWGDNFDFESILGYPCSTHLNLRKEHGKSKNIEVIGNKFENGELLK